MPFSIYKLTSPSGKHYIGVSKNVPVRWSAHKRRARDPRRGRHPLYDAISAYGPDAFSLDVLSTHTELAHALQAEIDAIRNYAATDRTRGYNISKGGEYDASTGGQVFWERIKKDPEALAAYLEKLSVACRKRDNPRPEHLIAYNALLPARERYYLMRRAWRVSARNNRGGQQNRSQAHVTEAYRAAMRVSVRLAWGEALPSTKKRWAMRCRASALAQWARRTDQEKKELAGKIGASNRATFDSPVRRSANAEQLVTARASIDRSKQGPAASRGLKTYWADLKKDPERYAQAMAARAATRKRNYAKKNV